jgi:integral membrane protein (TIGR00529 family)
MIVWLSAVPALVKILGALAVLLLVNRWSRSLTLAALAGFLTLGLWCGHGWTTSGSSPGLPAIARTYLSAIDTWSLGISVLLAVWLSSLMEGSGAMTDLVGVVRGRCRRRTAMAVLPAVIGWLPMPGGANFSAPLVEACDEKRQVEPLTKAVVNYWFRHIWEYWWPLYPGVLMATKLSHLEAPLLMAIMAPLSLAAVMSGWVLLLRRVPADDDEPPSSRPAFGGDALRFIVLVLPILVVVAVYVVLRLTLPAWTTGDARYLPIILGVLLAIIVVGVQRRIPWPQWRAALLSGKTFQQVLLTFLLCGFGAVIETPFPDGRLLAEVLRGELATWSIPPELIMVIIPFLIAMVTGICVAFVAASFPIVLGLAGADASLREVMAAVVLAYGSGYAGMLLSPVHFCLIQTNLFFKTTLGSSLVRLGPACAMLLTAVVGWWAILRWLPV